MSPQGSVWRKWDLHIHTPASFSWEGQRFARMTTDQADEACREIVERMNATDVAAFAVMDYWTFDGFLRIKAFLRTNTDTTLKKALFPGMELRCEAPADFRMNIHVILSDDLTEQQLADFKAALRNRVEYTAGAIEDPEINRLLIKILEGTRPAFENRDAKYFDESVKRA